MSENDSLIPAIEVPKKVSQLHMAIDTSSLSNVPEGVIGSIGFVVFDPRDTGGANAQYMKTIDWDQKGRSYNWPIVQGWFSKSTMARRAMVSFSEPIQLVSAIGAVVNAFKEHNCAALWGNKISLDQIQDAVLYCKIDAPWSFGQVRDVAAACSTSGELGNEIAISRDPTEPEDVPLGNAAFVARAVRHIYQAKGSMPAKEQTL